MTKEQHRILEISLCSYLPYGLKFKYFCPYDHENDRIGTIDGLDSLPNLHFFDENGSRVQIGKTCMPLLRPLSDLTKEITVGGRAFIPGIELFGENDEFGIEIGVTWQQMAKDFAEQKLTDICVPLSFYESLNKWHLDYRGLIDQQLAVSIHDLPENPYE
jgi:hypothetical protein